MKNRNTLIRIVLFILIAGRVAGQSLDDYLKIAEENNPGLTAKKGEFDAALQRIPQASTLPDPSLTISAFGQMVETRVGQQQARFSLSQPLPWFGTLEAQRNAAASMAQATYQEYLDARNQLFFEVRAAYYPLYVVEQSIRFQHENLDILTTLKSLATSRFQQGEGSLADALRIDLMINDVTTDLDLLEAKRVPLLSAFNELLNRESHEEVVVPDSLALPPVPVNSTDTSFSNNPKLGALDRKIESAEAREQVAIKQGMPRLGVGVEYLVIAERPGMEFAENGKDAWMPMVTVSLPIYRKKYKAASSEAQVTRESTLALKKETENKLKADLEMARYDLRSASEKYELAQRQTRQTRQIIELLQSGYANGTASVDEVLRMEQSLLTYQTNQVDAIRTYYTADARISYLIANDN